MIGQQIRSIDTNVLLRYLLGDHVEHSPRASALMLAVRRGNERIFCPDTVIFEALHVLQGLAGLPRSDIAAALTNLIRLPGFVMTDKDAVLDALAFWADQSPLDFAHCYHLALTRALGMTAIYTFDRKMDRYPGVERVEP